MFRRASLGAVTAFIALFAAGNPSAQYELVKIVEDRQGVMFKIQQSYWPLLDVKNGKSRDLAAAAAASQSIVHWLEEFSALLLPGTAKGEVAGSRATPEVWMQPAEFVEASNALKSAVALLSDAAASGDIELFRSQFESFASACVGCHELKPSGGGRFRAPLP